MKRYTPLFLALTIMGFFMFGCDSIVDQEPSSDIPLTGVNPGKAGNHRVC